MIIPENRDLGQSDFLGELGSSRRMADWIISPFDMLPERRDVEKDWTEAFLPDRPPSPPEKIYKAIEEAEFYLERDPLKSAEDVEILQLARKATDAYKAKNYEAMEYYKNTAEKIWSDMIKAKELRLPLAVIKAKVEAFRKHYEENVIPALMGEAKIPKPGRYVRDLKTLGDVVVELRELVPDVEELLQDVWRGGLGEKSLLHYTVAGYKRLLSEQYGYLWTISGPSFAYEADPVSGVKPRMIRDALFLAYMYKRGNVPSVRLIAYDIPDDAFLKMDQVLSENPYAKAKYIPNYELEYSANEISRIKAKAKYGMAYGKRVKKGVRPGARYTSPPTEEFFLRPGGPWPRKTPGDVPQPRRPEGAPPSTRPPKSPPSKYIRLGQEPEVEVSIPAPYSEFIDTLDVLATKAIEASPEIEPEVMELMAMTGTTIGDSTLSDEQKIAALVEIQQTLKGLIPSAWLGWAILAGLAGFIAFLALRKR